MREITLTVRGDTVHASRHRAGIQGEANATALVVAFDESWDGYAKKITFWDALEQNPVERTLTADLLVDAAHDTRTYRTTIPGEPLALAGECLLVIDGYVEGTRTRSMSVRLTVEEAPMTDNAGEPADPTPTQAEQLQVQIEAIMEDIGKAAAGAQAAEAAAKSAELAESYSTHPPMIGENGNWWVWAENQYMDTGYAAYGRGVADMAFDEASGRWVTTYTDGTKLSIDGRDPADSYIWSIFRDDFNAYPVGENVFGEQAASDWRISDTYTDRAYHDIGGDGTDKYVVFRTTGDTTRVATTINHFFQGEYTMEFDYMSMTQGGSVTDFFEVWLLATPEGATKIEGPIRARVNIKGRHSIHVNRNYTTSVSDKYMDAFTLATNTWYRVKISVKVGKIVMKIWKRDETEPAEGAAGTVSLESEIITEAMVLGKREIRLTFGVMNATPPAGGWKMGFDNVRVYRDISEDIMALRGPKGDQGEQGEQGPQGDRGPSGVYLGSGEMPADCNVQIDPEGDTLTEEELVQAVLAALPAAEGVAY